VRPACPPNDQDVYLQAQQFRDESGIAVGPALRIAIVDEDVLAFDPAKLGEAATQDVGEVQAGRRASG
jgi:hypothetical protein